MSQRFHKSEVTEQSLIAQHKASELEPLQGSSVVSLAKFISQSYFGAVPSSDVIDF